MITVAMLITVPEGADFDVCALALRTKTIRVGFPTANIEVYGNDLSREHSEKTAHLCGELRARYIPFNRRHLADWIANRVRYHDTNEGSGPLVILDGDTCFWKSCEDWQFEHPLAGYYNPPMWNDYAGCPSVSRLHTSFLWMSDTKKILERVKAAYPYAHEHTGEYCPCDPFMNRVQFEHGQPKFWDCCANLYHMIGGQPFTQWHLDHYEHVNSACFVDVMCERLDDPDGFRLLHKVAKEDYTKLRGQLWPIINRYYTRKQAQICVTPPATTNS